ncbi:MAG: rod shape-determining protein MreC [Candidatus Ancaeobacter aquaticus]|nr:rod shape-determining protein MreC [Candidatus Ancaeobacter aquaticus]
MGYYYKRRKKIKLWVLLVILAVVLLSIPLHVAGYIKYSLHFVISPFVRIGSIVSSQTNAFKENMSSKNSLLEENKALKENLTEFTMLASKVREVDIENKRLLKLVSFMQEKPFSFIPARVIGRDPSYWFESVLIDRGKSHGIKIDMPVVTSVGVVGKITEVGPYSSKVLLIIDKNSRAGGMLQDTRDYGIIEGESTSLCLYKYISRNARAQLGNIIVTSGLGTVYPKGLVIGEVTEIGTDTFGLYKYAKIKPACNFAQMEEVLVITNKKSKRIEDNTEKQNTP